MATTKRPVQAGDVEIHLKSERYVGHAGAPCGGYVQYAEHLSSDDVRRINAPSVYDLIERALGRQPEFGSTIRLEVKVVVVREGKPSRKRCHNPWPAHRCAALRAAARGAK